MQIKTENGYLIPLHTSHAEELFNLLHANRPFLFPWMPWLAKIHSPQDLAVLIKQQSGDGSLHMGVCLEGGTICGGVGFYRVDAHTKSAVLGYWLGEDYIGQGIIDDALRAICRYGFIERGFARLEIRCPAHNRRGREVPERLGFVLDDIVPKAAWLGDQYVDHACYSLTSRAFLARESHLPKGNTVAGPGRTSPGSRPRP